MVKESLEGERYIDENVLPLLSALATWKTPKIRDLMFRFGVRKSTLYSIIADNTDICILIKNRGIIAPTPETLELLKMIGEW